MVALRHYLADLPGRRHSRRIDPTPGRNLLVYSAIPGKPFSTMSAIFPIKDAAAAALLVIKADCLHNAGVISDGERQWAHSRARTFLADALLKDAA
jgi:hypothetical protein